MQTASQHAWRSCAPAWIAHRRSIRRQSTPRTTETATGRHSCVQHTAAAAGNGSAPIGPSSSSTGWLLRTPAAPVVYDAVLVLGGGLLPDGGLPPWVVRRLEGGRQAYLQQAAAGPPCPLVMLGAGTPFKPAVLDKGGFVVHEASAYATYLMQRGVPAEHLLKEVQSYDTVGNGYFSLLIHALPAGWRRLAVVTSDFHMPRTRAIFDRIYGLAAAQLHGDPGWFELDYLPVSDEGLFEAEVLATRAAKEAASADTWLANSAGFANLADLHAWLYSTHLCYAVGRQHEFSHAVEQLDSRLAATY